jgi:N-acetylglucosamine kinase-like BadF-type ATPase
VFFLQVKFTDYSKMLGVKIIADSGSTKTDWAIVAGGNARYVTSMGINPLFLTDSQLAGAIAEALAGVEASRVQAVRFYGAGCGLDANKLRLKTCFEKTFASAHITIGTDLEGAAVALFGNERGVACVLGTGANAGVYDGSRITQTPPSLGYILGDNGSGAALGLSLLQLYLHHRLPADTAKALEQSHAVDYAAILENVYRKERPNRFFASFAPFVGEHRGCPAIRAMLHEQFAEFFRYFILPYPEAKTQPVRIAGSVGFYFRELLEAEAQRHAITIDKVEKKPIIIMNYEL